MKRLSEKFKQAWGLGSNSKEWRPTSNGRNDAMLKDVRKFAMNLKQTHKQIKDLSTAVDTSMSMFRTVLLSPLPRAYDEMPAGVLPIDREVHLIGLNVTPEGLTAASQEVQQRLQQDVVVPLEQWLSAYRETKDLYKKCEAIRLDLDNKRRTVLVLQEKYQAKSKDGNRSKEAEAALHKVVNEEDKLTRLAQRYAEMEAQVFNAFLQLIRDSAMLRDFIASSLAFLQRCFTSAYTAFEVAPPPPMPVLPAPAPVPLLAYTPADINVSMRISANSMMSVSQGGAASSGMTGSPPKKSQMGSARPTGSAGSASNLGQSYGTTPQLLTSATFAHTTTTQPTYNTSATFAHTTTAPYPQAPPSPNADTMRRASQNHGFYPTRQPSSPNADQLPIPAPALAPVPPPHPPPTKQHSAAALVPQTAWRASPPPIPEQPLHSSRPSVAVAAPASENGSMDDGVNPFEQPLPSAPTHQVTRDPQNPFASEDGTGRQAIPA